VGIHGHRCQKQAPWRRVPLHHSRGTGWAVRGFAYFPSCLDPGNSQTEMPGGCEGSIKVSVEMPEPTQDGSVQISFACARTISSRRSHPIGIQIWHLVDGANTLAISALRRHADFLEKPSSFLHAARRTGTLIFSAFCATHFSSCQDPGRKVT